MRNSKKNKVNEKNSQNHLEELFLEDINTADDIPIDWLPKKEPITETMSYESSKE